MTERYAWRHYYWFLTDSGIEYLREFLNLPSGAAPAPPCSPPSPALLASPSPCLRSSIFLFVFFLGGGACRLLCPRTFVCGRPPPTPSPPRAEIVPATLKKSTRPLERDSRPPRGDRPPRRFGDDGPRGGYRSEKAGAPGEYRPEFRGGFGRGAAPPPQ